MIQNNQNAAAVYIAGHPFDGVTPAISAVLVKYTWFGDANLDGTVDGSDYSLIDAGYASHGGLTGWYNGDFNYDGTIDGSDYALIDNAFNNQAAALPVVADATPAEANALPVPVPEPTGFAVLVAAAIRSNARRRRSIFN